MRVAIYARVSTADQSVERQVRELRIYAQARGWEIVREFYEVAGGAGQKRPKRDKILAMARRRALDAILVHALDRWGRSVQDLVLTMAEIEALGVAFVVPDHIDMTTSMGRMLAHFLGAVAEFERELIRERVRSGLANARAKGKRLGRPPAIKFRVDKGLSLIKQGKLAGRRLSNPASASPHSCVPSEASRFCLRRESMRRIRVYEDTSVFGGTQDEEFAEESQRFFRQVQKGIFAVILSEQTLR